MVAALRSQDNQNEGNIGRQEMASREKEWSERKVSGHQQTCAQTQGEGQRARVARSERHGATVVWRQKKNLLSNLDVTVVMIHAHVFL